MRSQLKKIEDLGAAMEEALILDNKYTEHSTVGLAQQWDQLDQLGMRMQHNLEQQIQARYPQQLALRPAGSALAENETCHLTWGVEDPVPDSLLFQEHDRGDRRGPQRIQHDV